MLSKFADDTFKNYVYLYIHHTHTITVFSTDVNSVSFPFESSIIILRHNFDSKHFVVNRLNVQKIRLSADLKAWFGDNEK